MSKPQQLSPWGYALAGALGGVFSNAAVYPLDTVKTRIQADSSSSQDVKGKGKAGTKPPSVFSLLAQIYSEEGITGYYKGFGASMLNTFSMQYAYFFFYSLVRSTYIKRTTKPNAKPSPLSTPIELILGAIAGAFAQIFTIPVSVIATRQQLGKAGAVKTKKTITTTEIRPAPDFGSGQVPVPPVVTEKQEEQEEYDESFIGVAKDIIREDGVTGLWLGLKPGLVLTVNPAITYGMFERVKSVFTLGDPNVKLGPGKSFVVGALSKTLATVVTYPYIMAKVRIQAGGSSSDAGDEGKLKDNSGALDILRSVYKKNGIVGWYKGMGAQITKAVLSQALLFMTKEQFEQYSLVIMIVWYRLTSAASA